MIRRYFCLFLLVGLAGPMAVSAQENEEWTISQLMKMEGKVVAANERFVWIWLENQRSNLHEFYVCSYDVGNPGGQSSCSLIK